VTFASEAKIFGRAAHEHPHMPPCALIPRAGHAQPATRASANAKPPGTFRAPFSYPHPAGAALQLLAAGGGFRHGQGGLANPRQIAIFSPFAPAGTFPNKPLVPHFPVLNLLNQICATEHRDMIAYFHRGKRF